MNSTDKKRVWISSIIGILVILIIIWLIPSQNIQAEGILLPSNETRSAIPEKEVVFYSNPPEAYKNLGTIHIARHFSASKTKEAEKEILDLAKKLAAQAGANGVIVKFFAHSIPGNVPAAQAIYSFQGTAIYSNDIPSNSQSSLSFDLNPFLVQEESQ